MHTRSHHHLHSSCEPLESRIAPAALSVAAAGHGAEAGETNVVAAGFATFTVSLDAPQPAPVGVDFFTGDGTATAGLDYSSVSGRLVFAPGEVSKTVAVPVLDDMAIESDETITLGLANPSGATLANATADVAIWDNDTLVVFAGQEVTEGDDGATSALFTFALGAALAHPVSVSFSTQNGTATAGADYLPASGVITFWPGETAKVAVISILGDKLDEYTEDFSLITTGFSGARFGGGLPMRILDNDPKSKLCISDAEIVEGESGFAAASLVVSLDAPSAKTITVTFSAVGGSATADVDFMAATGILTFAPGETSKTIMIPVASDTVPEADEAFTVELSSAMSAEIEDGKGTVTILSDDSTEPLPVLSIGDVTIIEGDTGESDAEFTVTLDKPSTRTITVSYADVPGTATLPEDYDDKSGVLTFAPGETSKTIRVDIDGDFRHEADEAFTVVLSAPVNATLGDAAGTCTILNDDILAPPAITISDAAIVETTGASPRAAFVITLATTSADIVSVSFATVGGTATPGVDFIANSGTITFAPGQRTKTIHVTIIGDSVVEPDELFGIELTAPANAILADAGGVATIMDDDTLPPAPAGFIVTPRLAKWFDVDGDLVSVTSSLPILIPAQFNFDANGELALLNIATAHLAGTSLNFKVTRALTGDGSVNIGAIESPGRDLGAVTVKGSLGRIIAGDSNMLTPGLRGLTVETLGYLPGESGAGSLRSDVAGTLTKLTVRKSFNGASIYASGPGAGIKSAIIIGDMKATPDATDTGLHADGIIGTVRVTGSMMGKDTGHPVQIFAAGPSTYGNAINNVIVLGGMQFAQIVAGLGASPLVSAGWTSIGTVNVTGAILASTIAAGLAPGDGGFFGATEYSPLPGDHAYARIARVIAGNATIGGVINGTPDEISAADHFGIFARSIASVKIGATVMPLQRYVKEAYSIGTTGDVTVREF